ncbi:MAG: cytidine deaminase [Bacteroidales bacterium]|jgi:cytidine deaminase|nr:cytidine deaminase [Bacteroidales bacterium]
MKTIDLTITTQHYESLSELSEEMQQLVAAAKQSASRAYAPYSQFKVGAAILLQNGEVITGNNQENAAYPSGLCAERTAAFYASSQYPNTPFLQLAIFATGSKGTLSKPVTPCGSCRQALLEYENKFKNNITIILANDQECYVLDSIKSLLPFSFGMDDLV